MVSLSTKITRSKAACAGSFNDFRLPVRGKKPKESRTSSVAEQHAGEAIDNQILAAACAHDFDCLPHLEFVSLAAGEELHGQGENSDFVYFPETAVVSHLYNLSDGNSLEIAMVGREGATGLCPVIGSQPAMHQATVTIGGGARRIKTEILRQEFLRNGKFQALVLDYFNAHLAEVSQRAVCTSFHLLEKRLCSWLLMLHDRARENQITMTHEQMSQFLGVYRPTLTMVVRTLRRKGLINYVRGKLYILDRRGLENAACERNVELEICPSSKLFHRL